MIRLNITHKPARQKINRKTDTHESKWLYPGRVSAMLSRMHLHCCRWCSLQTRAVPSRLPLTNLRDGPGSVSTVHLDLTAPMHVKACLFNKLWVIFEMFGRISQTFLQSGRTGCCQPCPRDGVGINDFDTKNKSLCHHLTLYLNVGEVVTMHVFLCIHCLFREHSHTRDAHLVSAQESLPCARGALTPFQDFHIPKNIFWWHRRCCPLPRTYHLYKEGRK